MKRNIDRRVMACVGVLSLGLGACGGDDDAGDQGVSAPVDDGVDDADGAGSPSVGDEPMESPFEYVTSALSTDSLDPGVLAKPATEGMPAVVDTCAVLTAADVSSVAGEIDAEYGFGSTYEFTAETDGASCRYTADTHLVVATIGPAAVVVAESPSEAIPTPIASGDVTVRGWDADASVSVISEDSFDLDTPFAAHADAGDVGVAVRNAGGTGIDGSNEGELFARLAQLAAASVADAPRTGDTSAGPSMAGDPCAWYTIEEMDAFVPSFGIVEVDGGSRPDTCRWVGDDGAVEISLENENTTLASAPNELGRDGMLRSSGRGRTYILVEGVGGAEVDVFAYAFETRAGVEAEEALAENLASRLG